MGTFESRLIVSLIDKTQSAKGAMANLAGVEKAASALGKIKATSLSEISTALAKIGQHRDAEKRLAEFAAANEKARAKVRALAADMAAIEKPTKAAATAYQAATRAADMAARQLARQEGAVQKSAAGLKALGIAAGEVNTAETKLAAQAAKVTAALQKEAAEATRAARLRDSRAKEMVRAANEEAAANIRAAEAAKRAEAEKTAAVEQGARRRREALAREFAREAADQAAANRRMIADEQKAQQQRAQAAIRAAEARRQNLAMAGLIVGPAAAHQAGKAIHEGANYQHERVALINAGQGSHMGAIEARAAEVAKAVPSMSGAEGLQTINETIGAFGSLEHALENLEFVAKMNSVLKTAVGDKISESPGELGNAIARYGEMRGIAMDKAKFQREAGELVRSFIYFRGNVNPRELLHFSQQAQGPMKVYDEEFMTRIVPTLINMWQGDRAGTRATAFDNVVSGKARDKKQLEAWMKLGLLNPNMLVKGMGNAFVGWQAGAVKDTNMAMRNPYQWVSEVLLPAISEKGLDENGQKVDINDPLALKKYLGTMFRNTESMRFVEELADPRTRKLLAKDAENIGHTDNLEGAYTRNQKSDPKAGWASMTGALENLMQVATSPGMEMAAAGMSKIASGIGAIADATKDHPILAGAAVAGMGTWGLKTTWGLAGNILGGFGLKGSALALDGSAAALTSAAVALGGKGVLPAALTAGAGGAAVGWGTRLLSLGKAVLRHPLTWGGAAFLGANAATLKGLEDGSIRGHGIDPLGDQYRKAHPAYDADAARRKTAEHGEIVREMRREAERGRAMSSPMRITKPETDAHSIWPGASGVGEAAGSAAGEGVAKGLGRQSGLVRGVAEQILAEIRSVLSQGVDVPIRVNSNGANIPQSQSARAALRGALGDTGDGFNI
jgi:hypothetical protein